jgi:Tfp pilus assembly protein PilF
MHSHWQLRNELKCFGGFFYSHPVIRKCLNPFPQILREFFRAAILGCFAVGIALFAQSAMGGQLTNEIQIVEFEGVVEISPTGTTTWFSVQTNQILRSSDRVRTGANSRVALRWSDQSVVPFGASTELEILPPNSSDAECGLHLVRGIISFFHRDKPGRIQIITRGAVAGVEGTEFVLAVDDTDRTTLSLIDGKVRFGNEQSTLVLTNGQQAVAELGNAPARTAGFIANNILQWCFYYPAVLDLNDLQFTAEEQKNLDKSITAYQSGDLLAALRKFPDARRPDSDNERIYYAALLLSVGQVEQTEAVLASLSNGDNSGRPQRLALALRQLIAAVKHQPNSSNPKPQLATEFLADSYYEQSRAIPEISLKAALNLAKQAATLSPESGFAWERAAELEFDFGQTKPALKALDKSLALAPRNAQALALKGFLFAAQNHTREAVVWFDRALAADSALGNARLGRGLCRIRLGDKAGGHEDLLVAAALEPQRAELRSYLGKAYASAGDYPRAEKELQLAKRLDPNDPTPWLYSALLNQENNDINDGIRDLEKSEKLNDNRSVYRSQLLLDQDQAIRGANLAGLYQDAGMFDVSTREAARAVSYDYANYSAHLFLANSYDQLRDPDLNNLRYEEPANAEFLIANLLAPANAGTLSPVISQQDYSRLFEQNRFGVVSDTEYLSRGAWMQSGAQFGTFDGFSYDLEAKYNYDPGQRPNEDFEERDLSLTIKQQFTPQDSVFLSVEQEKIESGDTLEYYDPGMAQPTLRVHEEQDPNLFLGYHHEWGPGVHTLFLAAQLTGDETIDDSSSAQILAFDSGSGIDVIRLFDVAQTFAVTPEIYSTELQQIWEQPNHTTIVGSRYQWGDIQYQNLEQNPDSPLQFFFKDPSTPASQNLTMDFHHLSLYAYHNWQIADPLLLVAGLSYDYLHLPADVATTPFSSDEKSVSQISPKAGLIWTLTPDTTLRAAYTRSLSGAVLDQDVRLEPTEIAGFNQAFRSIIPESVVGDSSGAHFETYDISLEQKFSTGTYIALSGEVLFSREQQLAGSFFYDSTHTFAYPSGLNNSLNYRERSFNFTLDQLIGKQWSAGARYRLTQANLHVDYVDVPNLPPSEIDAPFQPRQNLESVLHQLNLHINWNHPSGFFSSLEADWYMQSNTGFDPGEPGDEFWQFNAYAGYRFARRKAEISVGLLNISDQDCHLEPLNLYNELPYRRMLAVRFKFNF